jgi:predicted RNA-binding Zn-ribbon protein involved in translation (DUF1610 family)
MLIFQKFICTACGHEWELPPALGSIQDICPACDREKVRRIDAGVSQQGFRTGSQRKASGMVMGSKGWPGDGPFWAEN